MFDKNQIQSNFNRFANNYSANADFQKQVASQLCQFANQEIEKSQNILDLGSGSGFIANNIKNKDIYELDIAYNMLQNSSGAFKINGDIEYLPFKESSFDLITSSLAFQWLDDLNLTLKNIKNCLREKSCLTFSVFIDGTLKELKESNKILKNPISINDFATLEYVEDSLKNHFSYHESKEQEYILEYRDIYDLLKSMKNIGASYSQDSKKNLKKKDFEDLNLFYLKKFNINDRLVSSWKVLFVKAYL